MSVGRLRIRTLTKYKSNWCACCIFPILCRCLWVLHWWKVSVATVSSSLRILGRKTHGGTVEPHGLSVLKWLDQWRTFLWPPTEKGTVVQGHHWLKAIEEKKTVWFTSSEATLRTQSFKWFEQKANDATIQGLSYRKTVKIQVSIWQIYACIDPIS